MLSEEIEKIPDHRPFPERGSGDFVRPSTWRYNFDRDYEVILFGAPRVGS